MKRYLTSDNSPTQLLDADLVLVCPHCGVKAGMTAISIPRFELIQRFALQEVAVGCRCDSCQRAVVLLFKVSPIGNPIMLSDEFVQVQRPLEAFEHQYLPKGVSSDLTEALVCFAHGCWNAFGAMARRCLQSVAGDLGVQGTHRVEEQLKELRALGVADDATFDQLKQIMLGGHDGAHPHLITLGEERAVVLLQLLKDVLYQLYVRPRKIKEAATLRAKATK